MSRKQPDAVRNVGASVRYSRKKRSTALALLVLLLFSLCACSMPWVGKGGKTGKNASPCVVLALPASGPYAALATKIRRGAGEAQKELLAAGVNLRMENINTEDPAWLKQLTALPEMCVAVGGPLQDKRYVAARNAGLLEKRAIFAFLPTLQNGDEGRHAWRFFPSPRDQVDALMRFALDDMKIRSYGAFYPSDNYGRRMTEIMEKKLARKHIRLHKASYNPAAPATWSEAIKPLINPTYAGDSKTPIPQTAFEAIFLPDSWKNMDGITTSMLYNGEDRIALLGTTLWAAGLSGKQIPKAGKYELAVFPDAWNSAKAPESLQGKGNDFWTALGYDFVKFAVKADMDVRLASSEISKKARQAAGAVRGIAPISWDDNGIASQRLYLFQVSPTGITPLDTNRFRQSRAKIQERAALRMQGITEENRNFTGQAPDEETGQAWGGSLGEGAGTVYTPVSGSGKPDPVPDPGETGGQQAGGGPTRAMRQQGTAGGIMSPTPVPSYKLRLPGRQ